MRDGGHGAKGWRQSSSAPGRPQQHAPLAVVSFTNGGLLNDDDGIRHPQVSMDFQAIGTAFSLLFLMELGDKTQLAVLSLTARTGKPMAVFFGAIAGLAAVTLLGVTIGTAVVTLIPSVWVGRGAAITFIAIGVFVLWSALRSASEEEGEFDKRPMSRSALGIAAGTSGLLFVAEMGDKSQLAVVGLAAQFGNPLAIFIGAVGALAVVTLTGALLGQAITRIIPVRWLTFGAGVMFVAIGLLTLLGIF